MIIDQRLDGLLKYSNTDDVLEISQLLGHRLGSFNTNPFIV